jgi:hypothetical protein
VFTKPRAYTPDHTGRGCRAGHQGTKTMTFSNSTSAFSGFASLVLAILPLVVIAGSLVSSF